MMQSLKLLAFFLMTILLLSVTSCGSNHDDGGSPGAVVQEEEEEQDDQGSYQAVLTPINGSLGHNTSGTVTIKIDGDSFSVDNRVTDSAAATKHLQNVTVSGSCPDASSDRNGDGLVDITEALPKTGPILIPLDSDLSEQLNGLDFGPIANSSGNFIYRRSTTLLQVLADLHAPDPDPLDPIVKLNPEENLNLTGRVVIIHGVANSTDLPDTVATSANLSNTQSLPVACGEFVRFVSEN